MDLQRQSIEKLEVISKYADKVSVTLDKISTNGAKSLSDISMNLPPREAVEFNFALAYAIVSMFGSNLRCQGTDSSRHAIQKEEERLRTYIEKLSPLAERQHE
jgi:hypothetical protein